jgi:hypothetical protein
MAVSRSLVGLPVSFPEIAATCLHREYTVMSVCPHLLSQQVDRQSIPLSHSEDRRSQEIICMQKSDMNIDNMNMNFDMNIKLQQKKQHLRNKKQFNLLFACNVLQLKVISQK